MRSLFSIFIWSFLFVPCYAFAQGGGNCGSTVCESGGTGATACSNASIGCSVSCGKGFFACCSYFGCHCCQNPDGPRQPKDIPATSDSSNAEDDIQGAPGVVGISTVDGGVYTIVTVGTAGRPLKHVFVVQNEPASHRSIDVSPTEGRILYSRKSIKVLIQNGENFLFFLNKDPDKEFAADATTMQAVGLAEYFKVNGQELPNGHAALVSVLEPRLAKTCAK